MQCDVLFINIIVLIVVIVVFVVDFTVMQAYTNRGYKFQRLDTCLLELWLFLFVVQVR